MREGWCKRKIEEIATITMGQSPSGNSINETEGVEFHQGKIYFGEKYINESHFYTSEPIRIAEPNSLLLCVRAPIGVVNMTARKICIGRGLCSIKANDSIHSNFLYYALRSQKDYFNKNATGSTFLAISSNVVKDTQISFPSKDKQIQIASELDKITEMISKYEEQLKELDKLSQSIFYEMFGDPIENEKEWEMSTIEMTCIIKSGNSEANYSKEGTLPYIKVSDMNLPLNSKYINTYSLSVDFEQNKKNIIPIGATIFPKRGGAIFTNKKRITNKEICCDLNIMAVIPGIRIQQEYLYMYFMFIDFSKLPNGSSVPQINNKDIGPLKIAIPPLPLQQSFARKIEAIEAMKSKVREAKKEAETLLAARMQYWFE